MDANFWALFWILLAGGLFATVTVLPYSLAINPDTTTQVIASLEKKGSRLPPMLVIVLTSVVQSGIIIALAIFLGLRASLAVGLRLPILSALIEGHPALPLLLAGLPAALLVGFGVGAVVSAIERYFFQPRLPEAFHDVKTKQATWKRLIVGFYGGIYEELLLRLFVMGGLIWLIGRVWTPADAQANTGLFWLANFLATILFGLGHLPATARMARLTPLIVFRALLLNGIAGIFFGYLFLRFGLETAMFAHFCMDIVMHVILPAIMPTMQNHLQPQQA